MRNVGDNGWLPPVLGLGSLLQAQADQNKMSCLTAAQNTHLLKSCGGAHQRLIRSVPAALALPMQAEQMTAVRFDLLAWPAYIGMWMDPRKKNLRCALPLLSKMVVKVSDKHAGRSFR